MSRPLPPGAPSVEAHAALVDCALALVRRTDPALEPYLVLGWHRARTMLGSALFVPEGAWYTQSTWYAGEARPPCATAKRAGQPLAVLRVSSSRWAEMSPAARGDTIAHELAHLSDLRDACEGLAPREASRRIDAIPPHGIGWLRWTHRYTGRVLSVRGRRGDLGGIAAEAPGAVWLPGILDTVPEGISPY